MRSIAILRRPISWISLLFAMIFFGLIAALALGIAQTATQFERSRDCHGAFSNGFSSGFDVYRCEMTIKHRGTGFKLTIPLS